MSIRYNCPYARYEGIWLRSFFTIVLLYFPASISLGKEIPITIEQEAGMLKPLYKQDFRTHKRSLAMGLIITVRYQYNETNVMHFLFNLLTINPYPANVYYMVSS
jgi:hypothetical protein